MSKKKKLFSISALGISLLMLSSIAQQQSSPINYAAIFEASSSDANNGKFYADFDSMYEAEEAALDVNADFAREGNTVLKNDGTLPLSATSKISVFGGAQNSVVGSGSASKYGNSHDFISTPIEGLEAAGYSINPTLQNYYSSASFSIGSEPTDFVKGVAGSVSLYNDAGIVILSRTSGEGNECATVTSEDQAVDENGQPIHANEISGKKHYLELTDSEKEMIDYVKSACKKVIILLNTSNVMEMGELNDDEDINAILWIGRPGANGYTALGELLSGTTNPSGRTVDIWARDFSKDPVWQNFGTNAHMGIDTVDAYYYADGTAAGSTSGSSDGPGASGFYGVDYEEGIYLGYRYYETRYKAIFDASGEVAANQWYEDNVVYPFGYGESYTTFSYSMSGLYVDSCLTNNIANTSVAGSLFASAANSEATYKTLYVPVTVTNTGSVAGKQTVQIYATAPYTNGGTEKSFVTFVGFEKTSLLNPGASETVIVEVQIQDISSYDYEDSDNDNNKGYELDAGEYIIRAMDNSHVILGSNPDYGNHPYASLSFNLSSDANLILDDYSGGEISNQFSAENGNYESFRNASKFNQTNDADSQMTELSRADMGYTDDADVASFPSAPTTASRPFTDTFWQKVMDMELYDADNTDYYGDWDNPSAENAEEWAMDSYPAEMEDWTQANVSAGAYENETLLKDMAGIDPYDDGEGTKAWTEFMNQLSWEEIERLVENAGYSTADVESIGKVIGLDLDDPLSLDGTFSWVDEPTTAATYNKELCEKQGIVVGNLGMFCRTDGWYGPGMNTHRSPFSGRNSQYYSQDGIQGGYIAAAVVKGATSRGLKCYVKHFVCNDQETNRAGDVHFTWLTEQALRENQLKVFQMAMQEGEARGAMTACARVGMMTASANYNLNHNVARNEWGWNGTFLTDGYNGIYRPNPVDLMIRCDHDLPLGNTVTGVGPNTYDNATISVAYQSPSSPVSVSVSRELSGTWDSTLRNGKGGVVVGGVEINYYDHDSNSAKTGTMAEQESIIQYYEARLCAQRVLYNAANAQTNHNGIRMNRDGEEYWVAWDASSDLGTVTQGVAVSGLSIAASDTVLNGADTTYEITDGALPSGLSLNSSTGAITGTASEYGTFTFTAKISADVWNTCEMSFTLTVNSAFSWNGTDYSSGLKVGDDFYGYLTDSANLLSGADDVSYSISSGSLPAGLSLDSATGEIEGTIEESGTFEFTINVALTTQTEVSMPWGGTMMQNTTTNYGYNISMTIAEAEDTTEPGETGSETDYDSQSSDLDDQIGSLEDQIGDLEGTISDLSDQIANSGSVVEETSADNSLAIVGLVFGIVGTLAAIGALVLVLLGRKKA